jgi:hypothetical protein
MTRSAEVEHAFELARSGQWRNVAEIIRKLRKEDRAAVVAHLLVPAARRELILVCSDAWLAMPKGSVSRPTSRSPASSSR